MFASVKSNTALDASLRTVLRTSALHERERSANLAHVFGDVANVLSAEGIDSLAVGGIALAHSVYPEPGLRHGSSISLVVDPDQLGDAAARLEKHGCVAHGDPLSHPAGPPIRLRGSALRQRPVAPQSPISGWIDTHPVQIGETRAHTVSLELAVLERCEEALINGSARSLNWVCDLWFIAARCGASVWPRVVEIALQREVALVAFEVLSYLVGLGAPVPAASVARLGESATRASTRELEAALYAASRSGQTGAWRWLRGCTTPDRIRLLRYGVSHRARLALGR